MYIQIICFLRYLFKTGQYEVAWVNDNASHPALWNMTVYIRSWMQFYTWSKFSRGTKGMDNVDSQFRNHWIEINPVLLQKLIICFLKKEKKSTVMWYIFLSFFFCIVLHIGVIWYPKEYIEAKCNEKKKIKEKKLNTIVRQTFFSVH